MAHLDTFSSVTAPRSAHQLDEQKLLAYLQQALPALRVHSGPLRVQQFQHGQSNPTFLLELPGFPQRMVLRKQPPGKLLASAHAVDREYRVLKALEHTAVPVPRPLVLCQDSSVIGTQFYVMEFAAGRIYMDPNLPELPSHERSRVYSCLAKTLADLHSLNPEHLGLEGFGNPTHYCRRQVERWAKQYHASLSDQQQSGSMHQQVCALISWLRGNVPAEDGSASVAAVVHGDFRLDNMVFDPQLQVLAVLDWELATLGNAWADVAYMCLAYHLPPVLATTSLNHPLASGIPSESEMLQTYCAAAGRQLPTPQAWSFYLALSLFRLLAILAGVQARSRQGNASSAIAATISSDAVLLSLAATALDISSRTSGGSSSSSSSSYSSSPCLMAGLPAVTSNFGSSNSSSSSSNKVSLQGVTSNISSSNMAHAGEPSGSLPFGGSSRSSSSSGGPAAARNSSGSSSSSTPAGGGNSGSSGGSSSVVKGPKRAAGLGEASPKAQQLLGVLQRFMAEHVYPAEHTLEAHATGNNRWTIHPLVEKLKLKAKTAGLWNLWMTQGMASKLQHLLPLVPESERTTLLGAGLSHLDYAHLCMVMGTSFWAPELFNCSAPDTGNMEVLAKYGTPEQQKQWLLLLLRGQIRSCFAMTEKLVASSDATNITSAITRSSDGKSYRVQGLKWWTSGAMDPRCKVSIFMGKTDPSAPTHRQQSMIIVPMEAPGVKVIRPMLVYGYDDAPHGHAEVLFDGVDVPASNLLLGEGRGFEIAQGRLGPGRLHHCMRLIGAAERALSLAATRALDRVAFGRPLAAQGGLREVLARQRVALEGARLLVLNASHALDKVGHKAARGEIAAAKVCAPAVALQVIDAAIQIHGGAGVSQDTVLAHLYAASRTLRIADGPDEVHLGTLAKLELEAAAGGPQQLKQRMAAGTRPKL